MEYGIVKVGTGRADQALEEGDVLDFLGEAVVKFGSRHAELTALSQEAFVDAYKD